MLVVTEPIMPEQSGKSGLEAHLADAFPGAKSQRGADFTARRRRNKDFELMITEIEGSRRRPPAKFLSDGMKAAESATTGERAPGKRAARPQSS